MITKLRGSLSYANVMVTLLAFVVLGGGAYAALSPSKGGTTGAKRVDFHHRATDPVLITDSPGRHVLLRTHDLVLRASCFRDAGESFVDLTYTARVPARIDHFGVYAGQVSSPADFHPTMNGRVLARHATYSSINHSDGGTSYNEDQVAQFRTKKRTMTVSVHTEVNQSAGPTGFNCAIEGTAVTASG